MASYPQEVVNSQIPDDYDILIAIFWGRIGTATPNFASGSVEELYQALSRNQSGGKPEVMVYFKDAPIAPSEIDTEQLFKIQSLKKNLHDAGCLYNSFVDQSSFESLIRVHLSSAVQKVSMRRSADSDDLVSKESIPTTQKSSRFNNSESILKEIEDIDEYGLLDYIDIYESKIQVLVGALGSIAEATVVVGQQISKRSTQLNELNQEGSFDRGKVRKIVDLSSSDLDQYTHTSNIHIEILHESRISAFDAMSHAIALRIQTAPKESNDALYVLETVIENLQEITQGALDGALSFRRSIAELPRMSVQLNRSQKRTVAMLDRIADELIGTIKDTNNIRAIIKNSPNSDGRIA